MSYYLIIITDIKLMNEINCIFDIVNIILITKGVLSDFPIFTNIECIWILEWAAFFEIDTFTLHRLSLQREATRPQIRTRKVLLKVEKCSVC